MKNEEVSLSMAEETKVMRINKIAYLAFRSRVTAY